ncbi:MAG: SAM-dependent methyltransferase [Proteobacteria bacterium SG_bin5]|nr:methyltransferase domain-containing protein [Sphingomonas sp.]OQW39132.1 MAG: SAM-dependent methyltransferase [Proteobacteria bacterium SG_bin5]
MSEAEQEGVAARRAALKLLDAVLRRGQPLEQALPAATQGLKRADDRGLVHALAAAVLRRLVELDALIDSATAQRLPDDAKARMVLRLALAQKLVLGTPDHAAIATVLPLVAGGPKRLMHGVFGTLSRRGIALGEAARLPEPVAARWRAAWGAEAVAAAEAMLAAPPALDLSLADPAQTDALAAQLGGVSLAPGHVRLARARVPAIEGFGEGRWWVQDLAASIPARLIGAGAGRALDLCAAPGGKTMQLAAAGWAVTALDISQSRLARLSENLARTGLRADLVAADALDWAPEAPFDAVLLDAPCTATGIFRRHPDVLHRIGPAQIAELADLQARLVARAADWVKPGGLLVYATCSLEPEEGEDQLARFLATRSDYALAESDPAALPPGIAATAPIRTAPGTLGDQGGCDGFFVAPLRRIA